MESEAVPASELDGGDFEPSLWIIKWSARPDSKSSDILYFAVRF